VLACIIIYCVIYYLIDSLPPSTTLFPYTTLFRSSLDRSYAAEYPSNLDRTAATSIKTMPEDVTGNLRPAFATLLAAVTLVLLIRSEEHTSELQSRFDLVCRLLLEKKKMCY